MNTDPFADFDPSPYIFVPNLRLRGMIHLGKALRANTPQSPPMQVVQLASLLDHVLANAEDALVVRLRESNEGSSSADVEFDHAVDGLWSLLRARVLGWVAYKHDGLAFLTDSQELENQGIDYDDLRERGLRGKQLGERLFGDDGLKMLQLKLSDQARAMATVHGLIEADELEKLVLELGGDELLPILRVCQARYEAMVQARALGEASSAADLRQLRGRLRRVIARYNGAVITMLDDSAPETLELVEAALEPMITVRLDQPSSSPSDPDSDEPISPADEQAPNEEEGAA